VTHRRCRAHTETDKPFAALYNTARWRRERKLFLAAHPICECADCAANGIVQEAKIVDHHVPHRGDEALFWDKNNWRAMARSCHDKKTSRELHARNRDWKNL
jgi:5-methylcytosine-specific restriction protein A